MDEFPVVLAGVASALAALLSTTISTWLARRDVKPTDAEQKKVDTEVGKALDVAILAPKPQEPPLAPSEKGKAAASAIMRSYMDDLVAEASRIAKQAGAEAASDKHVQMAASRVGVLRSRGSAWADVLVTVGSLLLGVAVSYQVNIWTGGTPTPESGLPMALAFGGGIGLAVSGWILKLRRV